MTDGDVQTWADLRAEIARSGVPYTLIARHLGMAKQTFSVHIRADGVSLPAPEFIERVLGIVAQDVAV